MTFYNLRQSATLLDRIEAGLMSQGEFEQEVIDEVYGGLAQYCAIPDGYMHCQLGSEHMDLNALDNDQLHELLDSPPDYIEPAHKVVKKVKTPSRSQPTRKLGSSCTNLTI